MKISLFDNKKTFIKNSIFVRKINTNNQLNPKKTNKSVSVFTSRRSYNKIKRNKNENFSIHNS